jgi:hypothetical protein
MSAIFSDRQRDDSSPKGKGESTYSFLARVAGPFWDRVRAKIEDMVARFCPGAIADITGRLQSGDDDQFRSAVWELLVHDTLRRLGFTVTCHPQLDDIGTHPDFLVENDDCSFYVEAKILGEDKIDADREQRRRRVYDEINDRVISEKFWLRVQVDDETKKSPAVSGLAKDLQAWLDRLDPDEVRQQFDRGGTFGVEGHTWRDNTAGWQLTFFPMAKNSHVDGDRVLGTFGGEARWIDDTTSIREALDGKARKYGKALGRPLVVALGLFRMFVDDTDVMDALYGDAVLLIDPNTGDQTSYRKPNGVWIGPNGARRDQLSAVVICEHSDAWRAAKLEPHLWVNPWAAEPLECELPYMDVSKVDENGFVGKQGSLAPLRELLELPEDWPGPEPPFPLRPRPTDEAPGGAEDD